MSRTKHHKSELQYLREEVKRLQREIKHLKREQEKHIEEITFIQERLPKCPSCYRENLKEIDLPFSVLYTCEICGYRKTEKKSLK